LLIVLAVIALGLAFIDSAVVPPEWNQWLPLPRLGIAPGERLPGRIGGNRITPTPVPGETPLATPGAGGDASRTLPQGERLARNIGFWVFGFQSSLLSGFASRIAGLLLLLTVGVVTLYAVPARIGNMASSVSGAGGVARLVLLGLAGLLVLAVLGVLSAAALLGGIAVLLLTVVVYIIAVVALVAVALPLGRFISASTAGLYQTPLLNLIDGLLVIFIVSVIPFIGTLLLALFAIVGFGALLQTRAGSDRGWDFDLDSLQY
jgi:hypothetical protein